MDVIGKPTAAMNNVAPNTATGIFISAVPAKAMTVTAAISVAAITACPALRRRNPMGRARIRPPALFAPAAAGSPRSDARQQRRGHCCGKRQQ
jgi:hypothetical protein